MKNRIKFACLGVLFSVITIPALAQNDPPNDINQTPGSANGTAAGKWASTPINLYTGMPAISVPIYHYAHHNGLNLNVSLDYFAGGVRMGENSTSAGLNWNLNAGGLITRTQRGAPDDVYPMGYLYTDTLPSDPTVNAHKYYYDSLDAEMDVFQFNFNGRSGKFYLGKNQQPFIVPLSKMKITVDTSFGFFGDILRIHITTEDGVKYVFQDMETVSMKSNPYTLSAYGEPFFYGTAWYLSEMIAPFSPDTIKFVYNTTGESVAINYPSTLYIRNSDGNVNQQYVPQGSDTITVKKLASIIFPDKKSISFSYSPYLKYDGKDSVLDKIKIRDSVFRYGYSLDWNCCKGDTVKTLRPVLAGIRYYTSTAMKPQYQFTYNPSMGSDSLSTGVDYWGFYNGVDNHQYYTVPSVPGLYTGANRNPSPDSVLANSLSSITDPSGGTTYYQFEANDLRNYSTVPQGIFVSNALSNSQTGISLSRVLDTTYSFYIAYDLSYGRNGVLSGSCPFTCSVTSLDGTVTYGSITTTLYNVASGVSFSFHAPNGSYNLNTTISSCSSTLSTLPIDVSWQNQTAHGNAMTAGGIRLKQLSHYDPTTGRIDTIATYRYVDTAGASSGFLGAAPIFSYPYQQTVINGSTVTTNYTAVSNSPINELNFTQGSPVGYSRVEVTKGSLTHNLGKEVSEFTNLNDAGSNLSAPAFPYAPLPQRDWAMGLPKRITIYDSTGRLISVTRNTYQDTLVIDSSRNFLSRRLAKASTTYNGDPNSLATKHTEFYANADYYPQSGLAFLVKRVDSVYHSDTSLQVTERDYQYDSNYNVIKTTATYDQTRGLVREKRFYYPYNYTLSGAIGKLRDSGVITPVISFEDWITGDSNPRMIGAQVTDYIQLPKGQIKPLTIYRLQSNAPVSQTTIGSFSGSSLVRNATYLVPQESFVTYDTTANLLEAKNVSSGQSSSIIMDYFGQFPIAKVTNAAQSDIGYTSFESDGTGNWTISSHARNQLHALTGKLSYALDSGNITKSGLNSSLTYILSYWSYTGASVSVSGSTGQVLAAQQNSWSLYTQTISGSTNVTVSGSGLIDELRLYPKDANMVTSTYEPLIGVTSTCDANSTVSYFAYDNLNRLLYAKDKDLNILSKYTYSDTTLAIPTTPFWQNTGVTQCETPLNGNTDHQSRDINPFSSNYGTVQWFFDHYNCSGACVPSCSGNDHRLVNCVCTLGTRSNLFNTHIKVGCCFIWRCTYIYCWPDGSSSAEFTEDNASPCTVDSNCLE
jgi:hypothetical protein